ncbi:acyltransferase [Paenibacillus sp.]|uniref:acyltransferase n=1 Tax=Paenibacillus sp. TaxID=58172 RepID=UPI0028123062|nr:acyltransferase [Paenibacillus sp.]
MERNYAVDVVKGLGMLAIVTIHTNPFRNMSFAGFSGATIDFILDTLSRFAVPFFFMAAGYLFGQKAVREPLRTLHLKKYIGKLAKLYAVWQIAYILYDVCLIAARSVLEKTEFPTAVAAYFGAMHPLKLVYYSVGNSGYHLWYLPSLMACMVVIFICYKYKAMKGLLWASVLLHGVGLFGQAYSGLFAVSFPTRDALFFGLFYTTLGFVFAQGNIGWIRNRRAAKANYIIWILAFSLLQLAERAILVGWFRGNPGDYFVSTALLVIVLFLAALHRPHAGKDSIWAAIGSKSAGIFVIHVLVINGSHLALLLTGYERVAETLAWNLLFTPLVFVASYFAYEFLQRWKGRLLSFRWVTAGAPRQRRA